MWQKLKEEDEEEKKVEKKKKRKQALSRQSTVQGAAAASWSEANPLSVICKDIKACEWKSVHSDEENL